MHKIIIVFLSTYLLGITLVFAQKESEKVLTPEDLQKRIEELEKKYTEEIEGLRFQFEALEEKARVAPEQSQGPTAQRLNVFNPRITVFGNFLGRLDGREIRTEEGNPIDDRFNLREVEIDFRETIDPWADGVIIATFESEVPNEHSAFVPKDYPAPLGFSLTKGWLDAWPHSHFSRRGTPFTHLFIMEPAFLDRDLFLDYRIIRGEEENEMELEAEIEWALTRRIGLVVEAPFRFLDPDEGEREEGFGDLAIAPRLLLVDTHRFLLSFNFEVEIPTGSERRGLGRGETALSPTISWWYDVGKWVAWSGQAGTEHGLEGGKDEVVYNTAFTFSLLGPALFEETHHEDGHGSRDFPPGLVNLITEVTARTALNGEESGRSTAEFLFGPSYLITSHLEIRGALQFPLFNPREFDNAYIFSLIHHF